MTYTALSDRGPRIALAMSRDLSRWERLGPVQFECYREEVDFGDVPNKDALLFPAAAPSPTGEPSIVLLHRPLFPDSAPEDRSTRTVPSGPDAHRESLWLSYVALARCQDDLRQLALLGQHHRLATPVEAWERVKLGGGAPPLLTPHGWLLLYHGVSGEPGGEGRPRRLSYSAGALVLDEHDPRIIRYRSRRPVLSPQTPEELEGVVANVVFPTATDRRDDLGKPDRIDVYYGMADNRIGAARLRVPRSLPPNPSAEPPV
jgi:predicted GH43/DUF377 family glycosyl hydrolase